MYADQRQGGRVLVFLIVVCLFSIGLFLYTKNQERPSSGMTTEQRMATAGAVMYTR